MLYPLLEQFFTYVEYNKIELYNEFSLQHELGIYLRDNLSDYKVQFERNVSFFKDNKKDFINQEFVKKEIDIVVFNKDFSDCYAVELKYPRNGQHPEQMYSFIKDIKFMEQLKEAGFKNTYCMTMVDKSDHLFFKDTGYDNPVFPYFRKNKKLNGKIHKPTGDTDQYIEINGEYSIEWIDDGEFRKRYLLQIP